MGTVNVIWDEEVSLVAQIHGPEAVRRCLLFLQLAGPRLRGSEMLDTADRVGWL
jgi:hypothetical protein